MSDVIEDAPVAIDAPVVPDASADAAAEIATDTTLPDTAPPAKGLAKPGYIYANTASELYSWLPGAGQPKKVGDFVWASGGEADPQMTDMAIDYDGRLYGVHVRRPVPLRRGTPRRATAWPRSTRTSTE